MSDKTRDGFKIRLDDSGGDHDDETHGVAAKPYPNRQAPGAGDTPPKKPGGRHGWIPFLFIGIIILAMLLGYMDIRNRLLSVHSSGSMETQHLSEDLETKFSNLSIKLSTLEESFGSITEGQTALTGTLATLKEELSGADKTIAALKSSKADKKGTDASFEALKKDLAALTESGKKNTADTAVMSAKLNATLTEFTTLSTNTTEKIEALKALLTALQSETASKKTLLTEIDHVENVIKSNQKQSDQQLYELTTQLQRISSRISELETGAGGSSTPAPSGGSSPASSSTAPQQGSTPSLPAPGELIERDISQ